MKFKKVEKTIIAISDLNQYDIYKCDLHGIYSHRNDVENTGCPYCKRKTRSLNKELAPLQEQFKKEIGLFD